MPCMEIVNTLQHGVGSAKRNLRESRLGSADPRNIHAGMGGGSHLEGVRERDKVVAADEALQRATQRREEARVVGCLLARRLHLLDHPAGITRLFMHLHGPHPNPGECMQRSRVQPSLKMLRRWMGSMTTSHGTFGEICMLWPGRTCTGRVRRSTLRL